MVNSPERSSGSVNGDRFPATSSPMVASGAASRVIDSTILNQAILQQIPGLQLQPSFSAANDSAANEVVTAMQQLLEAVDQSAPEPDFLMAEVHQKAQQVIQVLQAHPLEGSATNLERSAPYSAQLPIQHPAQHSIQNYVCLKDLTPWLLWGIARSAYGTMGLLEGVPATVLQPDQHWRNGILRLVALLEVRTPNFFYRFDLATQQVPEVLESDDLIQLGDSTFYPQPTTIAAATHRLVAQIQTTTPTLQPFCQGIHTEVLLPHQSWQPATFQLQLGFEFTPALPLPHPSTFYPTVKFTHSGWVEEYASAIARQYLAELLPNLASLQQSQPKIEALVKDAKTAGDRWNTDLTLTSRNFLQQNLQLDVLALRLLWCFSHSAYDVMQFMSGITVNLLQPGCTWQTGTLRLWIGLTVKTPDLDWHLDLMTGESPEVHSTAVELNSIVRSPQVAWLHQPMLLESLDARVRQHIAQATPELMLLIQGVEVDLLATDDQWQPGVMQLTISFEFIADITKWQGRDQREG